RTWYGCIVVKKPHLEGRTVAEMRRFPARGSGVSWAKRIMGAVKSKDRLFLIDSFGFIFRAYHARARSGAPPMRTSSGFSTEAVFIFHNMLRKLMSSFKPDYIAAIFESSEPTFRSENFADYKANRTEMPHDLGEQIPF